LKPNGKHNKSMVYKSVKANHFNYICQMKLRLVRECASIAVGSVAVNKLRTFLSLFGITIGIFAIISVFTVLDWMEKSIRDSISSLGDNIVYVQKMPWSFDPKIAWWDMIRWPNVSTDDYEAISRNVPGASALCFNAYTEKQVKSDINAVSNSLIWATTHDFKDLRAFEIENGRYFSAYESSAGKPVVILGSVAAEKLFNKSNPVGKEISIDNFRAKVIGVFKKEGQGGIGDSGMDEVTLIPLSFSRNFINLRGMNLESNIMVKAREGVQVQELTDEVTMAVRASRRLKPGEISNFSVNRASLLSQGFDAVFAGINLGGWLIGGFSILVGGFGIANIMFVSVRERTNIIGIQKALGAKRWFILLQFLMESMILSIIGGVIGLLMIFGGTQVVNYLFDLNISLTAANIILGIFVSGMIGIIAGFAPAWSAAKMNPVEAIGYSF
jgi:putative ABC transport system permease protein